MVRITSTQGRFDASLTSMATKARQPVFVDNAVHYAKMEPRSEGSSRITIEARKGENYEIATEKAYSIVESESSLLLSHRETDGHTLKSAIWTGKGKNAPTFLMYGATQPSERLIGKTSTIVNNGMRTELRNMKGRKLNDIGFSDDAVRFGQLVDVGFRTTDLAIKMANDVTGTLTAVSIGDSITTPNSSYRRKHSNVFLATDFNNVNLITAMRYLSRHDNGIPMYNRHGVLMYVPLTYFSRIKVMEDNVRLGSKRSNPVQNAQNRIVVQGRQIALNEDLVVTMDDRGRQQGKFDNDVIENASPVFDASITSMQQARRVARKMLKANSLLKGGITSNGHPHQWDIRPGDMVYYDNDKYMVTEARHRLNDSTSDFVFLSVDAGLDGILQGILEGSISSASTINPDKGNQIVEENFSFFDNLDVRVLPLITVTRVSPAGYLIGRNSDRGEIGGAYDTIGLNKDTPITIRGEM